MLPRTAAPAMAPLHPASPRAHLRNFRLRNLRRAYTMIEMLTTIAILVIVLGLMVSLARRVRHQSAEAMTKTLLQNLDRWMAAYYAENGHAAPAIQPLIPDAQDAAASARGGGATAARYA